MVRGSKLSTRTTHDELDILLNMPRRIFLLLVLALPLAAASKETALDRYVKAPDPSYKFELANTIQGEGYTAYILDLTSQTWAPPSRPIAPCGNIGSPSSSPIR